VSKASATPAGTNSKQRLLKQSRRWNIDDTDSDEPDDEESTLSDPSKPWLIEWNLYLQTHEVIPEGMGIVKWWGVGLIIFCHPTADYLDQLNAHHYPTWASLARDYLAIMALSVSSEHAFSAAGITISKRRNRLSGDIVEALECLKCMFHNDIIFRDVPNFEEVEGDLEGLNANLDDDRDVFETVQEAGNFSWDQLIADDGDDEGDDDEAVD
jgi:hypothetical protein